MKKKYFFFTLFILPVSHLVKEKNGRKHKRSPEGSVGEEQLPTWKKSLRRAMSTLCHRKIVQSAQIFEKSQKLIPAKLCKKKDVKEISPTCDIHTLSQKNAQCAKNFELHKIDNCKAFLKKTRRINLSSEGFSHLIKEGCAQNWSWCLLNLHKTLLLVVFIFY